MIQNSHSTRTRVNISSVPGINREQDSRRYAIVYYEIENTPWAEDESAAFEGDAEVLRQVVEAGLNERNETRKRIQYDASFWRIENVLFDFSRFPDELFHKVRKFVLYQIIKRDWRSLATICRYVGNVGRFLVDYQKDAPFAFFRYLHSPDILECFDRSERTLGAKCSMLSSLILFYEFLDSNYKHEHYSVNLDDLRERLKEYRIMESRAKEMHRYPSIPDRTFYQMHFCMTDIIRTSVLPFDESVTAAVVLLFMWTGLRPKEILKLRRNCLVEHEVDGQRLFFYEYVSPKNHNKVQSVLLFPAALEALRTLEKLQTRRENIIITDYLVSFWDTPKGNPADYDTLINNYDNLLCKYMSEALSIPHKDLAKRQRKDITIYRPCFYSFRVHLCTYLIDHGYDERWVEAHLGHLAVTMRGYYYRMKDWKRVDTLESVTSHLSDVMPYVREATANLREDRPEAGSRTETFVTKLVNKLIDNQ